MLLAGVCLPGAIVAAQPAVAAKVEPVSIAPPPVPGHETILTIEAARGIARPLTYADIEHLPMVQTTLETPWMPRATWQGVPLVALLDAYGLGKAQTLELSALDGYAIRLSREQIEAQKPVLATRRNGRAVPPADRGPLLLLWPSTAEAVKEGSAVAANWIWSLSAIRNGAAGDAP